MSLARAPRTLFAKIWDAHIVAEAEGGQFLLYIDRHYLSDDLPQAVYANLAVRNLKIRRPHATVAMPDHYVSTKGRSLADVADDERREFVSSLKREAERNGVVHFAIGDPRQGIVHVVGPEQALTLPGMTVVCGDSHASTHGALGAFGFGIGATEVGHVLATQTLWQTRPLTMQVGFDGTPGFGITAKDLALALIRQIGVGGATGHVIEYSGEAVSGMSMEARMTLCNLSIEAGARAGLIAPDAKTMRYLKGRPYAPIGGQWDHQAGEWLGLKTDLGAPFDSHTVVDAAAVEPMVSWGTNPSQCAGITERIPEAAPSGQIQSALTYMGLEAGRALEGIPVDSVFIGSCTNGRIEDLRLAASIVKGRRALVETLVVPGSGLVKAQAESEGLDRIFTDAGMRWGEPGCSMCIAINGDQARPGQRCVSTTNRNFVGRQGRGVRTHIVNPGMAAAAAVHGRLVDYRGDLR